MECPVCQISILPGQKFCGACGHKLESECFQCGVSNPPSYTFCGTCGGLLAVDGALTMARSGLINHADQKTAGLLGLEKSELVGKPFSLFVERVDLVVFFSHWNELLSSGKTQLFELALTHKENKTVYVSMDCRVADRAADNTSEYLLVLNEVTEDRLVSTQLQHQQDLLALIFTTTDHILSVTADHFDIALDDALKKICLFTQADRSFIYNVNRPGRCLELAYQWCQPACAPVDDNPAPTCLPLRQIKRAMVRFLQEQAYIVNDMAQLPDVEREELLNWHQMDFGAIICHLIRSGKKPIGIIGVAKTSTEDEWSPDSIALVKLLGQIVSGKLPLSAVDVRAEEVEDASPPPAPTPKPAAQADDNDPPPAATPAINQPPKEEEEAAPEREPVNLMEDRSNLKARNLMDKSRPMRLEKLSGPQQQDQQSVFPRDDGVVLLTCPRCGHQESVLFGWFEKLGNAISVSCPCEKQFAAILEKRRSFRKAVNLQGYFSRKKHLEGPYGQKGLGGPMVVKDLSKSGLRFETERTGFVRKGDLVMVRFNLDNNNEALIHKPAKVITINGAEIGCQFEGDDSYDITLGFYFL